MPGSSTCARARIHSSSNNGGGLWLTALVASASSMGASVVGATAWACPSCPLALTTRQQVYEQNFGFNLLSALAPFLLIGIVCAWVERLEGRPGRLRKATT